MASSFMGLYVQRDGLMLAQKSLDIVGNNITNVGVKGYARQRVDLASVQNSKSSLMYNTSVSLAGQGVKAVGVAQYRDALLDKKVRNYASDTSNVSVKVAVLTDVESAIDNIESETSGINAILSKFKSTLQGFSADNANRQEQASIAQSAAKSVVSYFNYFDQRLDTIAETTLEDTKSVVNRVNAILAEVGDLNKQITDSYVNMNYIHSTANGLEVDHDYGPLELKDTMHNLLDELSQYGNIDVKEEQDGSFTVKFAGQEVVKAKDYCQMAMTNTDANAEAGADPSPMNMGFTISSYKMDSAQWKAAANTQEKRLSYVLEHDNTNITEMTELSSGALRGYIDMYNGNGDFTAGDNDYKGIEYYRSMLNAFATTFADTFNSVYETDFGFSLFSYDEFGNAAETLRIDQDWLDNPILLAKPYLNIDGSDENIELANTYISKLLGIFENTHSFGDGTYVMPLNYTLEKFTSEINTQVGVQAEYEQGVMDTTEIMLRSVETARDELMGVNIDEEGVNMMNYQKWYNAIARMTSTLDEALDKLINGTGRVGL